MFDVNQWLGVRESYQAPGALMKALLYPVTRAALLAEYRKANPNLSGEHFREYFMDAQSDRKGDKQDYTPDSIGDIIAGIIGPRKRVLDIAGGIGGLTVHQWTVSPTAGFVVEEISSASLPFLLFNLLVRGIKGTVIHGDSLTRMAKDVYLIDGDGLATAKHTDEVLAMYNLRGWTDEL